MFWVIFWLTVLVVASALLTVFCTPRCYLNGERPWHGEDYDIT